MRELYHPHVSSIWTEYIANRLLDFAVMLPKFGCGLFFLELLVGGRSDGGRFHFLSTELALNHLVAKIYPSSPGARDGTGDSGRCRFQELPLAVGHSSRTQGFPPGEAVAPTATSWSQRRTHSPFPSSHCHCPHCRLWAQLLQSFLGQDRNTWCLPNCPEANSSYEETCAWASEHDFKPLTYLLSYYYVLGLL